MAYTFRDWHEAYSGKEDRSDRAETAEIFACKAGSHHGKNREDSAVRAKASSAELP